MKILKLTANNFKKLSAVEITPDGNVVIISGKNEAGKSSTLDSIEAALRGGRCLPKQPIKRGEIRGDVGVFLGDTTPEYKVSRKFFGSTSTLTVETVGETKSKISSPQAFLDKIVGDISFDPLAFMKQSPAEQRSSMMTFLGLNVDEFDNKIASLKEERSEVLKEKKKKLHEADSITFTPNLPEEEQGCDALLAELKVIQDYNEKNQKIAVANASHRTQLARLNEDITAAEKAISDWQKRMANLVLQKTDLQVILQKQPETPPKDTVKVEKKIQTLSETNEAIRQNNLKKQAMVDYETSVETYRTLGDQVKTTETNKALKMSQAVMPIEGLTIQSDGLAYENLPLEQECDSKKLKICVAIAMALNPELKVLRINGNELDKDSMKTIGELVAGKDYQVWIEKVSDDSTIGFYIEDGALKNENQ